MIIDNVASQGWVATCERYRRLSTADGCALGLAATPTLAAPPAWAGAAFARVA